MEGDDDAGGWKVGVIVDGRTPAKTQRWLVYLSRWVVQAFVLEIKNDVTAMKALIN